MHCLECVCLFTHEVHIRLLPRSSLCVYWACASDPSSVSQHYVSYVLQQSLFSLISPMTLVPCDWCSVCSDLTHKIVSTFAFGPCLTPLKTKLMSCLLFSFFSVFFPFHWRMKMMIWWDFSLFSLSKKFDNLPWKSYCVSTRLLDGSHQIRILSLKYQVVIIFWKKY